MSDMPESHDRTSKTYGPLNEPAEWDNALRPTGFDDFIGQDSVRKNLRIYVEAAQLRHEVLEHVLLSGLPGLGKTSLCTILAREMGANLRITSGPALEKPRDLVGILTSLESGDFLFIDEIHRLPRTVEEYLYSAMEDFAIDIMIDQGPNARSLRVTLDPFTLVGATTREGLLSAPFRSRFGVLEKLDLYPTETIQKILERTARLLNVAAHGQALEKIAESSRGVPRIANRILRRVRDLAQVEQVSAVDKDIAERGLQMMGIDKLGLETTDRRILECLVRAGGGPLGLKTVAVAVGEEDDTIEEVYEPYLIRQGFLERTPRGRKITESGRAHIQASSTGLKQQTLFDT